MNQEELLIHRQPLSVQAKHGNKATSARQSLWEMPSFEHEGVTSRTEDEAVVTDIARLKSQYRLNLEDILPKYHFLKQLQRERSRTDRSKAPLSIALFSLTQKGSADAVLVLLQNSKRETDILGHLGENCIAILLTDTNEQGAQRLTEKVLERGKQLSLSAITRTYPDQLFDGLVTENQGAPDLFPLLLDEANDRNAGRHPFKRGLDIVGALAGLLLFSPVMLAIALAIALTSPGPIIFRQMRLGKGGVPFVFYKFRSMRCNADDRIHREYVASLIKGDLERANQGDGTKPLYKLKADPRITRVGRVIRKTSLDELPQFFNVLKGDMSLVGPRPPLPYEVAEYQSWHLRRILEVKPGITGLWQVEGRSKTSFDDMVRLDLKYIRRSSLLLDLKLLFRTVKVVLKCDGAK